MTTNESDSKEQKNATSENNSNPFDPNKFSNSQCLFSFSLPHNNSSKPASETNPNPFDPKKFSQNNPNTFLNLGNLKVNDSSKKEILLPINNLANPVPTNLFNFGSFSNPLNSKSQEPKSNFNPILNLNDLNINSSSKTEVPKPSSSNIFSQIPLPSKNLFKPKESVEKQEINPETNFILPSNEKPSQLFGIPTFTNPDTSKTLSSLLPNPQEIQFKIPEKTKNEVFLQKDPINSLSKPQNQESSPPFIVNKPLEKKVSL